MVFRGAETTDDKKVNHVISEADVTLNLFFLRPVVQLFNQQTEEHYILFQD